MHKDKEYRRCAIERCDAGVFEELEFKSRGDGLDMKKLSYNFRVGMCGYHSEIFTNVLFTLEIYKIPVVTLKVRN